MSHSYKTWGEAGAMPLSDIESVFEKVNEERKQKEEADENANLRRIDDLDQIMFIVVDCSILIIIGFAIMASAVNWWSL